MKITKFYFWLSFSFRMTSFFSNSCKLIEITHYFCCILECILFLLYTFINLWIIILNKYWCSIIYTFMGYVWWCRIYDFNFYYSREKKSVRKDTIDWIITYRSPISQSQLVVIVVVLCARVFTLSEMNDQILRFIELIYFFFAVEIVRSCLHGFHIDIALISYWFCIGSV